MRKNLLKNSLVIIVIVIICLLGVIYVTLGKTSPLTFKINKPGDRGYGIGDDRSVTSEGLKVNLKFYSKSLKMDREVQIYLPQGYDQTGTIRYPVVYFLHGTSQNSYSEGELFSIVNNLIGSKVISPVIMVKPDGSCPPWEGSYFINSELYGNFEDYLVNDLTEFIDSIWSRWLVHDCSALARKISKEDNLAIYFDCGTDDETLADHFNTSFADSLDKLALHYEFQSYSGGHYDRYNRYPIGLAFLDSVMH